MLWYALRFPLICILSPCDETPSHYISGAALMYEPQFHQRYAPHDSRSLENPWTILSVLPYPRIRHLHCIPDGQAPSVSNVILYFSPVIILSDNATGLVFTLYISCMKYSLSYKLRYPLTADAAIPAINCFWKNRYISKTGMIDIAVAAKKCAIICWILSVKHLKTNCQ